MARVNHKKVKALLYERRSKISNRQFFTSRILAGHFEDMAAAQTRRYKYNRRIRVQLVWEPTSGEVAFTNNLTVVINTGNKLFTQKKTRAERYELVCGVFAHELGHCLYTDFLTAQTYDKYLRNGKWFPYEPELVQSADKRRAQELQDFLACDMPSNDMVRYVAHYVANVLEDGYIENRILSQFPGTLGYNLSEMRKTQFSSMPDVTQLIDQEEDGAHHIFESIMQMVLSYVKFGEIKYGETPLSDKRIQTVFGLIPELDNALINTSGRERWNAVNLVLIRCWDYIKDFLEECKRKQEDAEAAGGTPSVAKTLSEKLQALSGGSREGEGNSTPVPESTASCAPVNAAKRNETRMQANDLADESSEEGEAGSPASPLEEAENCDDSQGEANSGSHASGAPRPGSSGDGGNKETVSSTETGRMPLLPTSSVSVPQNGGIEYDDSYEASPYETAASDIERILDKMAERAACEQAENERLRELNDVAQNISYGDIHSGVSKCVHRIACVDDRLVDAYDSVAPALLTISRQLQRSLVQQLKDRQRGGKQTGLLMGRRLDAHALCRDDGKVFYKNALPNEIPQMSVALLLDESGSMASADRCTYARAAAIILYDFCQSLRIPIMIYGHSTGYSHNVCLYSYAEFESIDHDDKYRLMDISARGGNRDGAALRYVAEGLSKRPEEVKILILVSDGQPADYGYLGTAAEEDLRGIKTEYRRKGILFLAAAIGDDKQNIERIYGDAYMDITDLSKLPVKLTNAVKKHLM